jgi:flavin-dependent dehydrogenase
LLDFFNVGMEMVFDAVVVGSGPSGATAAFF